MKKSTDFILSSSSSRFAVCSLSIKVLLRVGRYLPSRVPAEFGEIKAETHDAPIHIKFTHAGQNSFVHGHQINAIIICHGNWKYESVLM